MSRDDVSSDDAEPQLDYALVFHNQTQWEDQMQENNQTQFHQVEQLLYGKYHYQDYSSPGYDWDY